jgi:tRNA(fMet)-specific endonuclease VapC
LKFFLDTNICIYFLKGENENLRETLMLKHPDDIKIPSIVRAELLYGAFKSQRKKENEEIVRKFLLPYEIIPFGSDESEVYAKLRTRLEFEGKIIGPNDLIIASTVLVHDGRLITNNEREFSRIESLTVENWLRE